MGETWAAVVVTYHRPEHLRRTVAALQRQTSPPVAVVVVDNGGDAGELPSAVLVSAPGNLGFGGGLSLGCRHLPEGLDFVLFADDDSEGAPDLVERLIAVAASHPEAGGFVASGGRLHWGIPRHGTVSKRNMDGTAEVDFGLIDHGLFRTRAVRDAGPPDGDLFMGFEDVDFTDRIRRAGWSLLLIDGPVDRMHVGSVNQWRLYYQVRNFALAARKRRSARWWLGWSARTALMLSSSVVHGRWGPARLRLLGAADGVRGVTGRRELVHR